MVNHPGEWDESGFAEIQKPPKRYSIIDLRSLIELSGFSDLRHFQKEHRKWVEQGLENGFTIRDERWSESIAVGSLAFVGNVKNQLGVKAAHRDVIETDGSYALREPVEAYGPKLGAENEDLSSQNTFFWDENIDDART